MPGPKRLRTGYKCRGVFEMAFGISRQRIQAISVRELNEIVRDPLYLSLSLLVPAFIMVIFGFGLVLDVEDVPLGIVDRDQSRLSRVYQDRFIQSDSYQLHERYTDFAKLSEDMSRLNIRAALIIPPDFQKRIHSGRQADVQFVIDGTVPVRAEIMRSYARQIHQLFLQQVDSEKQTEVVGSR